MKKHVRAAMVAFILTLGIVILRGIPAWTQSPPTPTLTAVSSDNNPAPTGMPVTITVVVSAGGGTPSGTVELFSGPNSLGTAALATVEGRAVASILLQLPPGIHPILANYYGDGTYAPSISGPPLPQRIIGK